jgi:hypothetical protein
MTGGFMSTDLFKKVERAQRAWRELELNTVTNADKERIWRVLAGMQALDDAQAAIRSTVEEVILEFWESKNDEVKLMIQKLIPLVYVSARPRPENEQEALDAIVRSTTTEKLCLQNRPQKPARKTSAKRKPKSP